MSRTTERADQVPWDEARRLTGFPHSGTGIVVDAAMNAPKQVVIGQRQAELDRARVCTPLWTLFWEDAFPVEIFLQERTVRPPGKASPDYDCL